MTAGRPSNAIRSTAVLLSPLLISSLLFSALLFCACAASEGTTAPVYSGMGFSISLPGNWSLSPHGTWAEGDMSIDGISGGGITLAWMRDCGRSPEEILGMISKAYAGCADVASADEGRMALADGTASTLDISYTVQGYASRKIIAAWRSDASDRIFTASFSNVSGPEDVALILKSFTDTSLREEALSMRGKKTDPWSIILSDLLSSSHYADLSPLPGRTVQIGVSHSFDPIDGGYALRSAEKVYADLPAVMMTRAVALCRMLTQAGYDAMMIQREGVIRVVVLDPSGEWQPISLNPVGPTRSVGAATDDPDDCRGIVYANQSELVISCGRDIDINPEGCIVRDCEPSIYARLNPPTEINESWTEDLEDALDGQSYPEKYREGVFDCSNTSQICWKALSDAGYDARLMMSWKGHSLGEHMWVAVRYPFEDERYLPVEATTTTAGSGGASAGAFRGSSLVGLGRVVSDRKYFEGIMYNSSLQFTRMHPNEGMGLV